MKTIAAAQADFRANDRDGNGVNDYWRLDVAGLYALGGNDGPIQLIELSVAAADDRSAVNIECYATPSTKAGYWYRALRFADEQEPDPDRFAFIAFPDSLSAGKTMFIIDHENTVYQKHLTGPEIIDVFPTPEELRDWDRLD